MLKAWLRKTGVGAWGGGGVPKRPTTCAAIPGSGSMHLSEFSGIKGLHRLSGGNYFQ